jgi:hypothetical protein
MGVLASQPPTPPAIADVLALLAGASRDFRCFCSLFLFVDRCSLALRARGCDRHESLCAPLHGLVRFLRGLQGSRISHAVRKGEMGLAHESEA